MSDDLDKDEDPRDGRIAAAWREAVERDGTETPPAARDGAILAAARAAVAARPRRPRYAVPLALAASVVVAVGLGLQQRQQSSPSLPAPTGHANDERLDRPDAASTAPPAPRAVPDADVQDRAAAPVVRSRENQVAAPAASPDPARSLESAASEQRVDGSAERKGEGLLPRKRVQAFSESPAASAPLTGSAPAGPGSDVIDRIRALIATGDVVGAAVLARQYLAQDRDAALPADLRYLLAPAP